MYDKIISVLKSGLPNIDLGVKSFQSTRFRYPNNKQQFKISLALSLSVDNDEERYIKQVYSHISDDVRQSVCRKLVQSIYEIGVNDFLDFTPCINLVSPAFKGDQEITKDVVDYISNVGCKNIITSARISADIMDVSSAFSYSASRSPSGAIPYIIGSIFDKTDILVDAFMRWDENFIIFFNECFYDLTIIDVYLINGPNITPNVNVVYELDYSITDPKNLYVFTPEYMKNYGKFTALHRDKKINMLLGEDEGS